MASLNKLDFFFEKLDQLIKFHHELHANSAAILTELGTPSTSVAVLDDGNISSYCYSTVGDNTNTLFQACSISKPVFGLAVMKLIDQGKFGLDDRIVDLLPEDVMQIMTAETSPRQRCMTENITVKQLLSHSSGLSIHGFPGYPTLGNSRTPTALEVISGKNPSNTMRVRLVGIPGHAFSYSGGGIAVLQCIVEKATGKDLASFMQETVLDPLDMTRSSYHTLPRDENNAAEAYHTGYTRCEDGRHTFPERAAAGLWTTPTDLLKVVRAVQQSLDRADNTSFLRQDTARQMLTEVGGDMGLSWFTSRSLGATFMHGGSNDPGWRCHVAGYAELYGLKRDDIPRNCGVAIMTNSAMGDDVLWKMVSAVAYLKNWLEVPRLTGGPAMIPLAAPKTKLDERWKGWIGVWSNSQSKISVCASDSDVPEVHFQDTEPIKLLPAAMPGIKYCGEEKSEAILAVLQGFSMMLRFGWSKDGKSLELFNGGNGQISMFVCS